MFNYWEEVPPLSVLDHLPCWGQRKANMWWAAVGMDGSAGLRVGADGGSTREATNRLWLLSVAQEGMPWLKSRLGLWGFSDPPGKHFLCSELGVEGSEINSQFLPLKSSSLQEEAGTRMDNSKMISYRIHSHFLPLSSEHVLCAGHCAKWWGFRVTVSLESNTVV